MIKVGRIFVRSLLTCAVTDCRQRGKPSAKNKPAEFMLFLICLLFGGFNVVLKIYPTHGVTKQISADSVLCL